MKSDEDVRNSKHLAMKQELQQLATDYSSKAAFITPEIAEMDKKKIPKPDFYADLNIINLPLFSASKLKIEEDKKNLKETIILDDNKSGKLKLVINYYDRRLGPLDRNVLIALQYFFCNHYDLKLLKKYYNDEYDKLHKKFLSELENPNQIIIESENQSIKEEAIM